MVARYHSQPASPHPFNILCQFAQSLGRPRELTWHASRQAPTLIAAGWTGAYTLLLDAASAAMSGGCMGIGSWCGGWNWHCVGGWWVIAHSSWKRGVGDHSTQQWGVTGRRGCRGRICWPSHWWTEDWQPLQCWAERYWSGYWSTPVEYDCRG